MMECLRIDDGGGIGIPDDEICIPARRIPPLARTEPSETCGCRRHRLRKPLDRESALSRASPYRRESKLQRRNAAPRTHEISVVEMFQRRWRGRVIRRDQI